MIKQIIHASLLSIIVLFHSASAMDNDVRDKLITVQKSVLLEALDNKTPLMIDEKQYKVRGTVAGTFGNNFRNSGDETLTIPHLSNNEWGILFDQGPELDENGIEIRPGMDGVAQIILEELK